MIPTPILIRRKSRDRDLIVGRESAEERDRDEIRPVGHEDAAVVVIDERPQLGRDLLADLADVVDAVELPAEALQHLQMRDRAHVARGRRRVGALGLGVGVEDDAVLALRLRGHHRRLGARGELARVHRVLGAKRQTDRDREAADSGELRSGEPALDALRDLERVLLGAADHHDGEFLSTEAADGVVGPHAGPQHFGQEAEELVADGMAVDVVHMLEVVDVEHEHRDRRVDAARLLQSVKELLVEDAVVEKPGQ